ncbi:MAG: serine/threonine protein kinase [Armatimonadetes bacterium]|nr:serine/threonine protein kinase [Armatimonadota bacterium]
MWLFCSVSLPAQEQEYTFHTYPPGARVYFQLRQPEASAEKRYVGESGVPIRADLGPYQDEDGKLWLGVTFSLPRHGQVAEIPDRSLLRGKRWPPTGETALPPESLLVGAADLVYWRPWRVVGTTLLVALGFLLFSRQRRALKQEALERERKRQLLIADSDQKDPRTCRRFGWYLAVDRIGSGATAAVYRAVPHGTLIVDPADRPVAIKVIHREFGGDPEFRHRFLQEVRTWTALCHSNILHVMDWADTDPLWLSMDLIEGPTLRERVTPGGLPVEEAVSLLIPLVDAMAYAHERWVVHRDLKPENVLLPGDPVVKIMDFGLVRSHQVPRQIADSGRVLGTPNYMAPEQIRGEATTLSDQYSLGIIAYELLAGRRPIEGDTVTVLDGRLTRDPPPLGLFRPDLPRALETLVMRMIDRNQNRRYDDLREVLRELRGLFPGLGGEPAGSEEPAPLSELAQFERLKRRAPRSGPPRKSNGVAEEGSSPLPTS